MDWVLVSGDLSGDGEEIVTLSCDADPPELVITAGSDEEEEEEEEPEDSSAGEEYSDEGLITYIEQMDKADRSVKINRLNQLIHLIFPHLPARSLLRFRSVSPKFKRLISSPFVILSHSIYPRRISGLFFHSPAGFPSYLSFSGESLDIPDSELSYLPELVTIKASTRGILCVKGRESGLYYVTNPVKLEWAVLPEPTAHHGGEAAVVVVFDEPDVYNFDMDYRVVCAFQVAEGVYAFESFSSATWQWAPSSGICAVEAVVPASGVAAGASAYWRTTMETILGYNPARDTWRVIRRPAVPMKWWELGEMEGKLSVTCVGRDENVKVIWLLDVDKKSGEEYWTAKGNFGGATWKRGIGWSRTLDHNIHQFDWGENDSGSSWEWYSTGIKQNTVVLRCQGAAEVVVFQAAEKDVVVRDLNGTVVARAVGPTYCADFLPYVSSLVPVGRKDKIVVSKPSFGKNDVIWENLDLDHVTNLVCAKPKRGPTRWK